MKEYVRKTPMFSLCGLNCAMCPRHNTDGQSKCPGCGGPEFHLKHPTCAVITCSMKHGGVEYCFECADYPCARFQTPSEKDSFISYRNVLQDFEKAKAEGVDRYMAELEEKTEIMQFLLDAYNDGKRKAFYCNAVNLLPLQALREVMAQLHGLEEAHGEVEILRREEINRLEDTRRKINPSVTVTKARIEAIVGLLEEQARKRNLELRLRK